MMLACLGLVVLAVWLVKRGQRNEEERAKRTSGPQGAAEKAVFALEPEQAVYARYAGSSTCQDCHAEAFVKWQGSHHGLAERKIDPALDTVAFEPPKEIKAGTQTSEARMDGGKFELITAGLKSPHETFTPERVIGVDPVRQFLIAGERGRWQTSELAWDPHQKEWFDVYGNEDRRPGEWGHWTGRGMTWNQMCASCHNTRVRKDYDIPTDSYHTAMAEMTVGCEACHGPMRAHVDWQKDYAGKHAAGSGGRDQSSVIGKGTGAGKTGDPTLVKLSRDQVH